MADAGRLVVDLAIILILILGISQFRSPRGARRGNLLEALALVLAGIAVMYRARITDLSVVIPALLVGATAGWVVAVRVSMVQIPAMVAFQHGAGGIAATLVSIVELTRVGGGPPSAVGVASGLSGLIIGAATFSGSMIASGKLSGRLRQTPTLLPAHTAVFFALAGATIILAAFAGLTGRQESRALLMLLVLASVTMGIVFAIRVGGADMPVLISFLNATAGLAAAMCGVTIENRLLIACGATVAASGSILTHVMCRAMSRSLFAVCTGIQPKSAEAKPNRRVPAAPDGSPPPHPGHEDLRPQAQRDPLARAVEAARAARSVIIVPGYGMALAEAQFEVARLSRTLESMGKPVRFAVHPVAGRMPGHMHVLLAEAEVDYDKLYELDRINPDFKDTDLVIVVGACDVVNPAAIEAEGTPISGMPILMAHEAGCVVVCNLDEKPGYSGVANPLYQNPKTILLLGDAKVNVQRFVEGLG